MPSPTATRLPEPRNWEDFEDLVADLFRVLWQDPYLKRFGRLGQRQNGIDILGKPRHLGGGLAAIQCKRAKTLEQDDVLSDLERAKGSGLPIQEFIVCTTAPRDTVLQQALLAASGDIRVEIEFWEDLSLSAAGYPHILEKHFPGWLTPTITTEKVWDILAGTSPDDFDYDDSTGIYLLRHDIELRIITDRSEKSDRAFETSWTKAFPDPVGYLGLVFVHYRNSRILTESFCWVDGARHVLPVPASEKERVVSKRSVHLAKILGAVLPDCDVDHAMSVAGIHAKS